MKLSADQQKRAAQLHREAIVIDSLGGPGPQVFTAEQLSAVEAAVTAGGGMEQVNAAMEAAGAEAWRHGGPPEYWAEWDKCGVTASSFTLGAFGRRTFTYENAVRDLAMFHGRIDRCPQLLRVKRAEDIEAAKRDGQYGLIFNFQNTDHLDGDLDNLEFFYNLGLRVIQLTYNSRNLVGDGCTERSQGGLSHFGLEVVSRMNEFGILVDVSHSGEGTTLDAIAHSEKPVAITHSMALALNGHPRGKADHLIKEIGQAEGYFGVLLVPFFLATDGKASLDVWLRHVEHVVNLAGIEHVGIGTDSAGLIPPALAEVANREFRAGGSFGFRDNRVDLGTATEGFESWSQNWPDLTKALVFAGYSDEEILGLLGGNFLRVFRAAVG